MFCSFYMVSKVVLVILSTADWTDKYLLDYARSKDIGEAVTSYSGPLPCAANTCLLQEMIQHLYNLYKWKPPNGKKIILLIQCLLSNDNLLNSFIWTWVLKNWFLRNHPARFFFVMTGNKGVSEKIQKLIKIITFFSKEKYYLSKMMIKARKD